MAEKIHITSSWRLPPTARQMVAISREEMRLGIKQQSEPSNRWEARRLLYDLRQRRKKEVIK